MLKNRSGNEASAKNREVKKINKMGKSYKKLFRVRVEYEKKKVEFREEIERN